MSAINEALALKLITLDCEKFGPGMLEYRLDIFPVIAAVWDAGFDEIRINVLCCPTPMGRRCIQSCVPTYDWKRFGEALSFGWLERRTGKYIQSGVSYHGTRLVTQKLATLKLAANGFATKPSKRGYDYFRECESMFGRRAS